MSLAVRFVLCFWFAVNYVDADEAAQTPVMGTKGTKCYDSFNRPQRCIPEFENAAFNLLTETTNTCGENGEQEYCEQTGVSGIRKSCSICHPIQHHAKYLTDFHNQDNPTWWQSETMLEGIQWPNQVNLTLKFGKAFDITYVRVWFWSPRPESFYISKRTKEGGPWIPYQYYSATCRDTYGLPDMISTTYGEEARALCTSEYSDISPLRGGNVAFGTLEGRPSAYYFDQSPELQEWVTATEIMITLDRINTFGDEVFGDDRVLKSYFYAIADFAVGARCKCNGHASECSTVSNLDGSRRRVCRCEHNTAGSDCNECLPFYNDAPWGRATAQNTYECKQCNCNGYSNRCFFDQKLYDQSGHGGHCLDCSANRDGPSCERCRENYFMREDGYCIPCDCNPVGSRNLQCNSEGKCQCKSGVSGEKCARCQVNHYDFSELGCKSCGCSELGSSENERSCDTYSGNCYCKENVEGKRCRECKPGFFNLDVNNKFGCTPCFCYGHSSECTSASGFSKYALESLFAKSSEKWTAVDEFGRSVEIKYESITQSIGVKAHGREAVYFVAPPRFLGDQRASYNQVLEFALWIDDNRAVPSATDIILEGNGVSVTNTIFGQQNRVPSLHNQKYRFRLHEHPDYGWQPRLSATAFVSILTNLTAIKIRGTYDQEGVGFLDDVKLETAVRGVLGESALWIESCDCPSGYVGQFCESCAPGFRHFPSTGGSFMPCIPCDCNSHASICDSETGRCICQHNTAGENCELCARGYYGNALGGTSTDCQPCNCPNGGACIQLDENTVMCTECPQGYAGHRCDSCSDGYYGDPTGKFNSPRPCTLCECNQNVDLNAIGNCNTITGECLKCIHNTGGPKCEACLPGYFGNALVLPKGDCKPCECNIDGTEEDMTGATVCDQATGGCLCKQHVVGRNCDKCENGYFNLHSGDGCISCNCDPVGSLNQTCDVVTGQCYCRPGVTGMRCDHCESRKYGFSNEGCRECNCDPIGTTDLQCDVSGQCPCLENVEGIKCERCKQNKYNRQQGCIDCPVCYNLIQESTRTHNNKLERLSKILDEIENQPVVISDEEFPNRLSEVEHQVSKFYEDVKRTIGDDVLLDKVLNIKNRENVLHRTLSGIHENIFLIQDNIALADLNVQHADDILDEVNEKMGYISKSYDHQGVKALKEAQERAEIVGQQSERMTRVAHDARDLANILEEKAENIASSAKEAKDKAINTYLKAKDATVQQAQLTDNIRHIKNDLLSTEHKLNKTKEWTKEVSDKTAKVKNNALSLLSEAENLIVPRIDVPELKKLSKQLKEEAYRLSNKSEQLFVDTRDLRDIIDDNTNLGKDLLKRAKSQQDEIEDFRNDLVFSDTQANAAINLWNEILDGAQTNYKLLTEFDTQTKQSKEEAEAALKTIGEIEGIINKTIQDTTDAQNNLEEARKNVDLAIEKAQQANELANDTSIIAKQVKQKAQILFKNTTVLREEAGLMFDRVQNTEGQLKNLLEKTKSNESLVHEAAEKVGRAGRDTEEVSRKVQGLLLDVHEIMNEIQNSPDIDDEEIDRLEEEIRRTEDKLKETKLEETLEELQREHKLRNDLIEQYKIQIAILQKEVENIEEIVGTLPEGCFRRVELEP